MPQVHHVINARKAIPGTDIKAGDSYYWWKFRRGGRRTSKTQPRRSQLTQSAFYSTLYDIEDDASAIKVEDFSTVADMEGAIDDIRTRLEELRDETQEKHDNMPDSLQQGPTGELLQERVDALESLISDLEGLDYSEPDEPDPEELKEEHSGATKEEALKELVKERCQELYDEMTGFDWSIS